MYLGFYILITLINQLKDLNKIVNSYEHKFFNQLRRRFD